MEKMLENLVLLLIALGGAKVLIFYLMGKTKSEMAATVIDCKTGKVANLSPAISDHYKYIYSQEEIYGSLYSDTQRMFNVAMKNGQLSSEQIRFIERYLRNELNVKEGKFKNNAHCIYSLMRSPILNNDHYHMIQKFILDFTKH